MSDVRSPRFGVATMGGNFGKPGWLRALAAELAVPAAHAMVAEPGLFTDHEFVDPPPSWSQAVRMRAQSLYSTSVHGALLEYDWTDLCDRR